MLKKNVVVLISIVSISLFIIFMIFLLSGNCCFKDRCEIPTNQFSTLPLFFNFEDGTLVYPQEDAIIVQRDESISIGCPGSKLNTGDLWARMTCITETSFVLYGGNTEITDLYCQDQIKSVARYTGESCENNGREIEVGFDLGSNKFIKQLRICFKETEQTTLYTEHILTNLINNRERSPRRPYFEEDQFFNLSGNKLYELYSKKVQRKSINKQLGIDPNSTQIIKDGNSSYYLTRGHLAPKADFVYAVQQNASFYYVNAVPQWENINSGSWNTLEWKIRNYASKRDNDLQIITGTFGKLILKVYNSNNLYLYYNPPSVGIPIPKYFWKVVYDPLRRKGIAFVGTNNPYMIKEDIEYICKDILTSINWIKLKNQNATSGIVYACDVNELRKIVTYIPMLQIDGVLTD